MRSQFSTISTLFFLIGNNGPSGEEQSEQDTMESKVGTEKPPVNEQEEEEKTGSPFDYLQDVLGDQSDLSEAKNALDSEQARQVVDQYGSNLTILAPTDQAFAKSPRNWSDSEESKAQFLANHLIPGQRLPIYTTDSSSNSEEQDSDERKDPRVIRPNLEANPNAPLVHVIDRVNTEPIGPKLIISLQPALSTLARLMQKVQPDLERAITGK